MSCQDGDAGFPACAMAGRNACPTFSQNHGQQNHFQQPYREEVFMILSSMIL
jgi:hypothetical protein